MLTLVALVGELVQNLPFKIILVPVSPVTKLTKMADMSLRPHFVFQTNSAHITYSSGQNKVPIAERLYSGD